ncbi:cupin domain-containing protein [Salinicoccus bachuensis]|uniref:Cupin domain-containing protein n=1 Tax=Salinicoccus bachuensis TaxID=3136731 RepID=A0ABZ3CK17_9STAP
MNVFKKADSTMFVLNFLPGQKLPEHNHPGHELYFHLIQGEGQFPVDGEDIEVVEEDVIHIGPEERNQFRKQ